MQTEMLNPHLEILPESQKALWNELSDTPDRFVLYGGTALALRIGHRQSIDFDFFSNDTFAPDELYRTISYLKKSEKIVSGMNTLVCIIQKSDGPVKVSFFGGLDFGRVGVPEKIAGPEFYIASIMDLAATKIKVIQDRAESKDYNDIAYLFDQGISLSEALAAAMSVYGDIFNPMISLRALTCFTDGDLPSIEESIRERIIKAVQDVDIKTLPDIPLRSKRLVGTTES